MRQLITFVCLFFSIISNAQPSITSFYPTSGSVGTSVNINGNNFNTTPTNNTVYFGAVKAVVTAASATSLTVTVPSGATSIPICITTGGLTGYSSTPFIVTFPGRDTIFRNTMFKSVLDQSGFQNVYALSIVDMDDDKRPDIVATEGGNNKLTVLLNSGGMMFESKTIVATNNNPIKLISLDVDGDGKQDIITLNNNFDGKEATISLYRNAGKIGSTIELGPKQDFLVSRTSVNILSGDVDSDGKPDIIIGTTDSISIFLNKSTIGSLSLANRTDYQSGVAVSGNKMAMGDMDGDGKSELVLGDNFGQLSVFKVNQTGVFDFSNKFTFPTINSPAIPIISDIDGDGKNDLVSVNIVANKLSILRNTSTGSKITFDNALTFETTSSPSMVNTSDLDGDGKQDLIVVGGGGLLNKDTLSIFKNTSTPGVISLKSKQVYSVGTRVSNNGIAAGDVNGDAKPDILLSTLTSVSVLRNRIGEPSLVSVSPQNIGFGDTLILRGHLLTDVSSVSFGGTKAISFTINNDSTITAISGSNGSGGFVKVTSSFGSDSLGVKYGIPIIDSVSPFIAAPTSTITIRGANFNSVAADNVVYFGAVKATVKGGGKNVLNVEVPRSASYGLISVTTKEGLTAFSKINFIPSFISADSTIRGTTYRKQNHQVGIISPSRSVIKDMNGDGKPEYILLERANNSFSIFHNVDRSDSGMLSVRQQYPTEKYPEDMLSTDIDGDGNPDVITLNVNYKQDQYFSVYHNTTSIGSDSIRLAARVNFSTGSNTNFVGAWAKIIHNDIDGDGKTDLLINGIADTLLIFRNTSTPGNISFAPRFIIKKYYTSENFTLGDLDSDGKPELVISGGVYGSIRVFQNKSQVGQIVFQEDVYGSAETPGVSPKQPLVADIDGDGKNDIAFIDNDSNFVSVVRNTGTSAGLSFARPVNFSVGKLSSRILATDVNGDGKPDLAVSNHNSNYNSDTISIYQNTSKKGIISFARKQNFSVESNIELGFTAGDLDGDNKPDFLMASETGSYSPRTSGIVSIWFNRISEPSLVSVSPQTMGLGDTVVLRGHLLTGVNSVSFSGINASSFTVNNDTTITAILGNGGASGFVKIISPLGSDSLSIRYGIPVIDSVSPIVSTPMSTITIRGTNFNSIATDNIVYFGAVKSAVKGGDKNVLHVEVPKSASYGLISVTTKEGLTAFSNINFIPGFVSADSIIRATAYKKLTSQDGFLGPRSPVIKDMDGDGKPDYIILNRNNHSFSILRNTGKPDSSMFSGRQQYPTEKFPDDLLATDIDGDGKPEIIVVSYYYQQDQYLSVYRNISTGPNNITLADRINIPTGINLNQFWGITKMIHSDIDGDGKMDILISGPSDSLFIFRNTSTLGNISFAPKIVLKKYYAFDKFTLGDLDGDNKPELIINGAAYGKIAILQNKSIIGKIEFQEYRYEALILLENSNYEPLVTDIDGDGKNDIAFISSDSNYISILRNNNASSVGMSFSAASVNLLASENAYQIKADDINGDGKPDLIVVNHNSDFSVDTVSMYQNTSKKGVISFSEQQRFSVNTSIEGGLATGDLDGDGKPDFLMTSNAKNSTLTTPNPVSIWRNRISEPIIASAQPLTAKSGDTIIIKGNNFSGVTSVNLGNKAAASFRVVSDTLVRAVVNTNGANGSIFVANMYGTDSLNGFIYLKPEINFVDSTKNNVYLTTVKGNYSFVDSFLFAGKYLESDLTITAPINFEVSKYADTGFSSVISVKSSDRKIDPTKLFIRFKNDTSVNLLSGTILFSSVGASTKSLLVTGKNCDSTIYLVPQINSINKDSTICFKDSLKLNSPNGNYTVFKWSNGDSTKNIVALKSEFIKLQIGVSQGCLSRPSAILKLIKNTNPTPVLALTNNESTLLSSNALNYRWFLNNQLLGSDSNSSLLIKKIGFYRVETSNDKICWDRSNDFMILSLTNPLVNDTVAIKIYPNPSTGFFYIVAKLQNTTNVVARVTVADANGLVLFQTNKFIFYGREIKIPVTLNSYKGIAFVRVEINGDVETKTIIIQ